MRRPTAVLAVLASLPGCASAPPAPPANVVSTAAMCAEPPSGEPLRSATASPEVRPAARNIVMIPTWRRCCERSIPALAAFANASLARAAPATAPAGPSSDDDDAGRVGEVLARQRGALEVCYACALAEHPALAGRASYRVVWNAAGDVQAVAVAAGDLGDAELRRCVMGALRRVRFPALADGTLRVATLGFRFDPGTGVSLEPPLAP